jgi:hypothetical protein
MREQLAPLTLGAAQVGLDESGQPVHVMNALGERVEGALLALERPRLPGELENEECVTECEDREHHHRDASRAH